MISPAIDFEHDRLQLGQRLAVHLVSAELHGDGLVSQGARRRPAVAAAGGRLSAGGRVRQRRVRAGTYEGQHAQRRGAERGGGEARAAHRALEGVRRRGEAADADVAISARSCCAIGASTIGRYDSRFTGIDADDAGESSEYDPSRAAIFGPFTATINDYLRNELKFDDDHVYEILTGSVQPWKYDQFGINSPDRSDTLRQAMAEVPFMKLFVAEGYYDLATPPADRTDYSVSHMRLPAELRSERDGPQVRRRAHDVHLRALDEAASQGRGQVLRVGAGQVAGRRGGRLTRRRIYHGAAVLFVNRKVVEVEDSRAAVHAARRTGVGTGRAARASAPSQRRSTIAARWPPKAIESLIACSNGSSATHQRHAVQVALGVLVREIQRRRREAVAECQRRQRQLDAARSVHQVAQHRLVGADANRVGRPAQRPADAVALHHVVLFGAGAVGVDVGNVVRREAARRGASRRSARRACCCRRRGW